jgi:hypothetical protein
MTSDSAMTSDAYNRYCSLHRPNGSVNVIRRKCIEPNRTTQPSNSIVETKVVAPSHIIKPTYKRDYENKQVSFKELCNAIKSKQYDRFVINTSSFDKAYGTEHKVFYGSILFKCDDEMYRPLIFNFDAINIAQVYNAKFGKAAYIFSNTNIMKVYIKLSSIIKDLVISYVSTNFNDTDENKDTVNMFREIINNVDVNMISSKMYHEQNVMIANIKIDKATRSTVARFQSNKSVIGATVPINTINEVFGRGSTFTIKCDLANISISERGISTSISILAGKLLKYVPIVKVDILENITQKNDTKKIDDIDDSPADEPRQKMSIAFLLC